MELQSLAATWDRGIAGLHLTCFDQSQMLQEYFCSKKLVETPQRFCFYGVCRLVTKSCPTLLKAHGMQLAKFLSPWDSLGKNTAVGCHALLQGIFPTQESNRHLLDLPGSRLLYPQRHLGSSYMYMYFLMLTLEYFIMYLIFNNVLILK